MLEFSSTVLPALSPYLTVSVQFKNRLKVAGDLYFVAISVIFKGKLSKAVISFDYMLYKGGSFR